MHLTSALVGGLTFVLIAALPATALGETSLGEDFQGRVQLDRSVYSDGDRVRITAIAPGHDTDREVVEAVVVTVATRGSVLRDYPLRETGPGTGVFSGDIVLTDAEHDASGDGWLAAHDRDAISVSFQVSPTETALASSPIRSDP